MSWTDDDDMDNMWTNGFKWGFVIGGAIMFAIRLIIEYLK